MIHGAIVSHRYLIPTAELLAAKHQVFAPDLPGHGESDKPEHALPVLEQAELLKGWLQENRLERICVVANSYGCAIAVELAIMAPDVVTDLILTSPASDPEQPSVFGQALRLIKDSPGEHPLMGAVLIRDAFTIGIERGLETCQIMVDYDYRPRLPLIKMRTLVVRGGADPLVPEGWANEVSALIPDSSVFVIEKAPHDVTFSSPKELAEAIEDFLR